MMKRPVKFVVRNMNINKWYYEYYLINFKIYYIYNFINNYYIHINI